MTRTEAGETVLQAFTSDAALPSGWSTWQRATGRELAGVLAGKRLQLNPGSAVTATIPGDDVAARVRG